MGLAIAVDSRRASTLWRRGAIGLAVAALHLVAFLGLLVTHIVDLRGLGARQAAAMTYVVLPPPPRPAKQLRVKSRTKGGGAAMPYFNPETFVMPGVNAITLPNISAYVQSHVPRKSRRCPLVLRPDSPEWKRLCAPGEPEPEDDGGTENLAEIRRIQAVFARVEAEQRKRYKPAHVPCTYTKKYVIPGGPFESSAAMTDVGCAAREWFGR